MIAITKEQTNRWFVIEVKRNLLQTIFLNNEKYILCFGYLDLDLQLETIQKVSVYATEDELKSKIQSLTGDTTYYDTSNKNLNN